MQECSQTHTHTLSNNTHPRKKNTSGVPSVCLTECMCACVWDWGWESLCEGSVEGSTFFPKGTGMFFNVGCYGNKKDLSIEGGHQVEVESSLSSEY